MKLVWVCVFSSFLSFGVSAAEVPTEVESFVLKTIAQYCPNTALSSLVLSDYEMTEDRIDQGIVDYYHTLTFNNALVVTVSEAQIAHPDFPDFYVEEFRDLGSMCQ